jgi:hypothetical protein
MLGQCKEVDPCNAVQPKNVKQIEEKTVGNPNPKP